MRAIIAILSALVTSGCSSEPEPPASAPAAITPTDALADRFELDGRTYVLTATIWRDFMPGPEPRPSPVLATLKLQAKGGRALPLGVVLESWSIRHGEEVWRIDLDAIDRRPDLFVARDGPAWPVGETVDLDVALTVPDGRRTVRLGLRKVAIERTD